MERAVAVIDIGMTNKKIAVYDSHLKLLSVKKKNFEPLVIDGVEAHDLVGMEEWFLDVLSGFTRQFDIRALAVTTHGATFVCTDESGRPVLPCFFYTYEPGEEFHRRFYSMAGDPVQLQAVTGTPRFSAMINPAKGLFFLKEKHPEAFGKIDLVLPYPQYWGMRLTGKAGVEGTYIGCHTYLYDWEKATYSSVAHALGITEKLPFPLHDSWEVLGTVTPEVAARTGLSQSTVVTMGIHDSNASLLPYLVKDYGTEFIVNSTGTWCVLMHPQDKFGFAPDELGKVVFFNRSAYNKPVKTAIFLGGKEYEVWTEMMKTSSRRASVSDKSTGSTQRAAAPASDACDPDLYRRIIEERAEFILPEIVPGSGQFPGSPPRAVERGRVYALADMENGAPRPAFLSDPAKAEAVLNISLALQTLVALERAGLGRGMKVFTEGGFRNNAEYNAILAAALPDNSVYLTDMSEATSFGAALTALAALRGKSPSDLSGLFSISQTRAVPMTGLNELDSYRKAWFDAIANTR
jgi:sugar (pentulose or hexulose) kinase